MRCLRPSNRSSTARFSFEDVIAGVLALKDVRAGTVPAPRREFVEKLWTEEDWERPTLEFRLACVILIRDSSLNAVLGAHRVELQESMERRLLGPLQGLGLTPIEAWIVVDAMLSVMHHVTSARVGGGGDSGRGRRAALDRELAASSRPSPTERTHQCGNSPALIMSVCAVTMRARSDAKNTTASATSPSVGISPSGMFTVMPAMTCSGSTPCACAVEFT